MVTIDSINGEPESTLTPADDPEVISLDDDGTIFETLSSVKRRQILQILADQPTNIATLANRTGMSIQNITYHIDILEKTGLVTVVDTHYSVKGRETDLYGPTCPAIVIEVLGEDSAGENGTHFLSVGTDDVAMRTGAPLVRNE